LGLLLVSWFGGTDLLETTLFNKPSNLLLSLAFSLVPISLNAQGNSVSPPSGSSGSRDAVLTNLRSMASQVEDNVRVPGYPVFKRPKVMLDAGMGASFFTYKDQTVHTAQFGDLPTPMQAIFNQWASYTTDQPAGDALFDDMFHRFFFVHELGHWMASQVIAGLPETERDIVAKNEAGHKWEREIAANRIAVAWYRQHDPKYLAKLVEDFRRIQAHLPNPVPIGVDRKTYFTENYDKLGTDPMAYGWYHLQMVLLVYEEPVQSFQQVLNTLPKNTYQ
jgi:hypothetical protein